MRIGNKLSVMARRFTACLLASVVLALVSAGSLIACPFLLADPSAATKSCCPRSAASDRRCPLSESMETCPYYIAEARIGITEPRIGVMAVPVPAAVLEHPVPAQISCLVDSVPDELHRVHPLLMNCVLRI